MIKLKLSSPKIFPWRNLNNKIFIRGYFFSINGDYLSSEDILQKLLEKPSKNINDENNLSSDEIENELRKMGYV